MVGKDWGINIDSIDFLLGLGLKEVLVIEFSLFSWGN